MVAPIPWLPTLAWPVSDFGSFLYACQPRLVNGYNLQILAPNSLLPRARSSWTNSRNPRYSGSVKLWSPSRVTMRARRPNRGIRLPVVPMSSRGRNPEALQRRLAIETGLRSEGQDEIL